jgi:hypothetical protein
MENAFRRVAPSVRFSLLAIFAAAVFFFAIDFSLRTSLAVQARRLFVFLAMSGFPPQVSRISSSGILGQGTARPFPCLPNAASANQFHPRPSSIA